jgi:hypothetical protein
VYPHRNIYLSAEPSPEDEARLDGYIRGKAEEHEKRRLAALAEPTGVAGPSFTAESPSQPVPQPSTPAPQPPPPGA